MNVLIYVLGILTLICIRPATAVCTWPDDFANSNWTDSLKGDMVFGSTHMVGWSFNVLVNLQYIAINDWECVNYDTSGPYLIMKTTNTFIYFNDSSTGYRCLRLEKLTDFSYRYYQMTPVRSSLQYDRLYVVKDKTLTSAADVCVTSPASGSEFQVMLKTGFENEARVTCPYHLLMDYTFTYNASGGPCDPVSDVGSVDMCSNVTQITVPSLSCSPYPLYSSADTLWCVDVLVIGTNTFVSLYNAYQNSTFDDSNTYPFTCIGIDADGTSMSVTPQHCKANQSSSEVPVNNIRKDSGAVLSLTGVGAPCPPCTVLSNPVRGSVVIATNGAVTMATYSCDGNYTLSGNDTRICQTDGTWSDSPPSCTCPIIMSFPHGSISLESDGLMSVFTCDAGYVLVGEQTLTCDTNTNTWSHNNPTCDQCQSLTEPTNGSYIITSTGLTSTVTYSCDAGTTLNGDTTRTCKTDTSWTSAAPKCTSCPMLSSIASGNVTLNTDSLVTIATYYCAPGYTLVGAATSTCLITGNWDSTPPACVSCPTVSDPDSGTVMMSTDGIITVAHYACATGYVLDGENETTCLVSGSWSNTAPECLCEDPDPIANGTVVSDGRQLTYACNIGYSLRGSSGASCQAGGLGWSDTAPECVQCSGLTELNDGRTHYTTTGINTMAEFTCDVGTTLNGSVLLMCHIDGSWNGTVPSCVTCEGIAAPASGVYAMITDGATTSAELQCNEGYEVTGATSIVCTADGTWSINQQSTCVCKPPEAVLNGHFDLLLNGILANYSCGVCYELVGPQQRSCLTDGTGWNGTEPRCDLIITTPSPSSPDKTVLPIPTAAFIALVLLIIILVIAFILIAVCSYFRYRKERQRIGTTFDSADSRPIGSDEARFNFEPPDIEDGSLRIMKDGEPAKSKFDERLLKNKSSLLFIELSKSESGRSDTDRNGSIPRSDSEHLTGTPPHVPLSAVRLPALPPKPAKKREATRHKRKRRRAERPEDKITSSSADESKPRTSTPTIETIMSRTQTPDILSSETFEYIQPIYCPEVATPAPSRPGTATSRAGSRPPTSKSRRKNNENESNV